MSELTQGLIVTVFGLGLLFAALSLIGLLLLLLTWFFPAPKKPAPAAPTPTNPPAADEEVAAAIATALIYWRLPETAQNSLGSTLEAGHGPWWLRSQPQSFSRFSITRRRK